MDKKTQIVAKMIDAKGSRRSFAEEAGLVQSTLQSMLTRGIGGASVDNVLKVCKALDITVEQLQAMETGEDFDTPAARISGEDWTGEELEEIERFKDFVKSKRGS
ncbi:helix-turn-helix transcriptional regulator [Saccharibacillus sp. CPCC 101409]|uniref:helix-turn-helix domain-containing protein n=1 Tax=Saccharibacillus sp. CPCC 101409 TaxID=3058041 RepID=UPI0026728A0C|nr:helix-turn-helix transcriptional regulator [Saccharibacillus sp. CPCC 101409]MDO3408832.1 helix-turn-helix transcriptional regulator [Saccharibacillus sp. CPCC 101409]